MNPFTDILFIFIWFILLVWAIRTIARGWGLYNQPIEKEETPSGVWTTQVKKPVHPEMVDVKPGEELMGVTFDKQPDDPLLQSLQERIEELSDEEEDDEDDGGDIIVRI
tara:strand:+ start:62 stop:388 length:327 start_codon:yes stop_codon:yes gene_type:complete